MELDEVLQRVLRRYGIWLLLAVVIPIAAATFAVGRQAPSYVASARVQLTATTPDTATAADAVVSQAAAAVTSVGSVRKALASAGVDRDVPTMIRDNISVTGLGTSSTIDIAVTDSEPWAAQRIAQALAGDLVSSTNTLRLGTLPDVLASIDNQLTQLATKRAPLAAAAQAHPQDAVAQNRLAGIDRLISDLSGDRNRLALEAAAGGHATILDPATVPGQPLPSKLPQILVLVGLCGLVLGLLVVALLETLRPHVSGADRISRMLRSPVLGRVVAGHRSLRLEPGLTQRARLAAYRAGSELVVVVPVGRPSHLADLVARLDAELVGRVAVPDAELVGRVAVPDGAATVTASAGATVAAEPATAAADPATEDVTPETVDAEIALPDEAWVAIPDVAWVALPDDADADVAADTDADAGVDADVDAAPIVEQVPDEARVPDEAEAPVLVELEPAVALAGANGHGSGDGVTARLRGLLPLDPRVVGHGNGVRTGHATGRSAGSAAGDSGGWNAGPTLLDRQVPVTAPPPDGPAAVGGDPAGPSTTAGAPTTAVRVVRALADLDPDQERQAVGVVVVSPPMASRVGIERVEDLLQLSGWPLLGVVTVRPSRRFWER